MFSFYTSWKLQKTSGFPMYLGDMERDQNEMGYMMKLPTMTQLYYVSMCHICTATICLDEPDITMKSWTKIRYF